MVREIVKTVYSVSDVALSNDVVASADMVEVQNDKVVLITSGSATINGRKMTFSMYGESDVTFSMQNVPATVDATALIKEFITKIEADL